MRSRRAALSIRRQCPDGVAALWSGPFHTQFIMITHSRRTMEAADVLYGVTMEEAGCSRLVSVNFAEIEAV